MQKEIIDRLKQEGALLRNSGAHSIKSVKEILVTNNELVTSSLNSIQGLLLSQNSILSDVLDVQKQIAKTLDENLTFDQETERDRRRDERLNDQDQDPEPEKKSVVSRVLGTAKNILKKTPSILAKIVAGLLAGPIIFGFLKAAFEDIVENTEWGKSILEGVNSVRSLFDSDFREKRDVERTLEDVGGRLKDPDFGKNLGDNATALGAELTRIETIIRESPENFDENVFAEVASLRKILAPMVESLAASAQVTAAGAAVAAGETEIQNQDGKTLERSVESSKVALETAIATGDPAVIEEAVERLVIQEIIKKARGANVVEKRIGNMQEGSFKSNVIEGPLKNVLSTPGLEGMFPGEEFQRLRNDIYELMKNLNAPDQTSSLVLNPNINVAGFQPESFRAVPEIPTRPSETQVAMLNASGGGVGGFAYMGGSTLVNRAGDQIITNAPTSVTNIALSDKQDASEFVSYV